MYTSIIIGFLLVMTWGLWQRFHDDGIKIWMLETPGLEGLCADYLDHMSRK
jgi:hypothetical protein